MTKRMLIDAAHPEETRVVIVDSNRVEELDFESRHKRQLRGNVYLARVTRVEPSLQAAFIEYGGNRHGFLAFSEIHPDYYRIPEADKQALKEQEEEDQRQADEEEEKRKASSSKRKSRTKRDEEDDDADEDDIDLDDQSDEEDEDDEDERDENLDPDDEDAADETDLEVAEEQVKVASKRRKRISRRRYKIQEVIKRGQILLVQAVKEERGNKGAAMTTYLSLAGRYCVLMPNTPRGGGISRKIANGTDRKRLKTIMNNLEVPQGMGVIVRTAGAKRTKTEIGRDYEYLSRLWSEIRETTMESSAPALIHEEGNLVKRSIRDLYNKDIEEVLVQGDEAYKTASDFINMLMPSHAKHVKHYDDEIPLFLRYGAEKQIENSLDATVQLKSGGYLVIHPTEALVSVDVNSGRSTKERNIERTALRTNLEAAEELARQMRLRDLAGLIVVDFIDMDENKNNRAVERKMKEMLSQDRARIQTSRISQFGLMEISRQRRRRSLLEGSTTSCPHCSGVGRKRTIESSALAAIRAVEEFAVRGKAKRIRLKTSSDVALYLLNEKRDLLTQVDEVADVFTEVVGDDAFIRPHYELEVIQKREDKRADPLVKIESEFKKEREAAKRKPKKTKAKKSDEKPDTDTNGPEEHDEDDENRKSSRRRGRRGRRGGRGRGRKDDTSNDEDSDSEETSKTVAKEQAKGQPKSKRKKSDEQKTEGEAPNRGRRRRAPGKKKDVPTEDVAEVIETVEEEKPKPKRRSTTRRKAPPRKPAETEQVETKAKPKRTRKTPSKKAVEKEEVKDGSESKKSTRTRKAPAKKASAKKGPAEDASTQKSTSKKAPVKKAPAKKAVTRKAPAKKTAAAKAETPKKKKAPAKKAAPKKPAAKKKAPAKKAAATKKAPEKKAPVKKTAAKAEVKTAEKDAAPKRTRKAPARTSSAKAAEKTPAKAKAAKPVSEVLAKATEKTVKKADGKIKKGWWKRRKKD
jgi:ribonuclease E